MQQERNTALSNLVVAVAVVVNVFPTHRHNALQSVVTTQIYRIARSS